MAALSSTARSDRSKPATGDGENNDYRFERPVTFTHTGRKSRGRIDLYKRGCFILEAKQGGGKVNPEDQDQLKLLADKDAPKAKLGHGPRGTAKWDDTMLKARNQADDYARAVSKEDGWPPFLMVVDVGHVFEIYADFSRAGRGYTFRTATATGSHWTTCASREFAHSSRPCGQSRYRSTCRLSPQKSRGKSRPIWRNLAKALRDRAMTARPSPAF
ncbi:MAG: type IIL restriction-modification enzyme MmeI [Roseibium sp.]